MWTLADFCILVDTKWIPSDTCKNYHRSWHLEFYFKIQKWCSFGSENIHQAERKCPFSFSYLFVGKSMSHLPLAWCCNGLSPNLSSESDGISAFCTCLWATTWVLSSAMPWGEFFFLFCLVIAFPLGLQLSCAKHWLIWSIDTCLTEIYP